MVHQDYVRLTYKVSSRRKKNKIQKKQINLSSFFERRIIIVTIILVVFISDLCFIRHYKNEDINVFKSNQVISDNLPSKPAERWRYIKILENRKPAIRTSIKYSNNVLKQIEQPINTQHQYQIQEKKTTHRDQDLSQVIIKNIAQQLPIPIVSKTKILKKNIYKTDNYYCIIQCGSFKYLKQQARIIQARLAFLGCNSYITTDNNGWNYLVIGPIKDNKNIDIIINGLKILGYSKCISLISKIEIASASPHNLFSIQP